MENPLTFHPVYLLAITIGLVQTLGPEALAPTENSSNVAPPEPYYVFEGVGIGGGFLFYGCWQWNALHVIQKRYNVELRPEPSGCFATEETTRMVAELRQQSERVDQALRQAGILPKAGSVRQMLSEEYRRQYRLDTLLRRQAFFSRQEEKGAAPVFIKAEPLDGFEKFTASLFQENRYGQMFIVNQAYVDLSTLEIKLLNTAPAPANYPWNCPTFRMM